MTDSASELLPDPLPAEPLEIAALWLDEACRRGGAPNPNAMTVATRSPDGRPSARIVLCKEVVAVPGYLVFYTNYESRKGEELAADPRAAAVLHFDRLQRQVRVEGRVTFTPAEDSDAYFASRTRESRIGAWASDQSRPIRSRAELLARVAAAARRFPAEVPRPQHWGGYRLWAENVELWAEGPARIHDRARWTRTLTIRADGGVAPGPWTATRLQP